MIKRELTTLALLAAAMTMATAQKTFDVNIVNDTKTDRKAVPVTIALEKYGIDVKSALVTTGGKEVASQLDDLDGDGKYDELCFLTDIEKKGRQTFNVKLEETGEPRKYEPQVYAASQTAGQRVDADFASEIVNLQAFAALAAWRGVTIQPCISRLRC